MKVYRKLFLLMGLIAAVGCVKEDHSQCVRPGRMTLFFTYNQDQFRQHIRTLDVFIFDSDKRMYRERRFSTLELSMSVPTTRGNAPGWVLADLPPGVYYVVCWGNVGSASSYNRTPFSLNPVATPFESCYIRVPVGASTGDPIYYAPFRMHVHQRTRSGLDAGSESDYLTKAPDPNMQEYSFTVADGEIREKELSFGVAHRTVNVYIINYPGTVSDRSPVVEAFNLGVEYDFFYASRNTQANFSQPASPVNLPNDSRPTLLAPFHFAFGQIRPDMDFKLRASIATPVIEEVNLEEFIVEHKLRDANGIVPNVINIVIEYTPLGVNITLPTWNTSDVTPG